jgi:hypothetical protein
VIHARGTHVHSRRFTDDDFDRITFLENARASEILANLYQWNINSLEINELKLFRQIIWCWNNY